jgi:galacturonosyltransferase
MKKIILFEGDINNAITGFRKDLVISLTKSNKLLVVGFNLNEKIFIENNSCQFINLGKLTSNPFKNFYFFIKVFRIILEFKPNITLSYNLRPNLIIGLINKFIAFNSIATITGTTTFLENKSKIKTFFLKFIFSRFNFIFFQNIKDKKLFENLGLASTLQSVLVPGSGINLNNFTPYQKKIKKNKTTFILIARLIKEKGVLEYIKAAELIKAHNLNVEFLLLGPTYSSGNMKNYIDISYIIKNEKLNNIRYLGVADNVNKYIENADCVVLPSYGEGMSNVLLEACALGTPVIASNVSGCYEIIDDGVNGFLCQPKDYYSLYEKIIKFINLDFESKFAFGENGRKKIEQEFDVKIVINKYLEKIIKL